MKSFIEVSADHPFPIQNLPYGVFKHGGSSSRIGVAIGDYVLDLHALAEQGHFNGVAGNGACFKESTLNSFMSLGKEAWSAARKTIQNLLNQETATLRDNADLRSKVLIPIKDVQMQLPAHIGDYTDFYSSKHHATNVGKMFRPNDAPLLPNWTHVPVGYHGRSSSIVISGTNVVRPSGQTKADDAAVPSFTPCRLLDFELETGFFVGPGNELGSPIPIGQAKDHIFGMVLLNDWSARDIQKWEYVPLGPFLAKNFCSTISPWIVTMEALEPFRCDLPKQEPELLPYLKEEGKTGYNIALEVSLKTKAAEKPQLITKSNFNYMYYSMTQHLTHHASSGCNMRPGDLCGSGTISGPEKSERGCMLELTWRGTEPIKLESGEERKFLQDGDTIIMTGYCKGDGYTIGFGECTGTILPTRS